MRNLKKYFIVITLALTAVLLVGCKEDLAPELTGATDLTTFLNVEVDPTEGIVATDAEDGDLTADVVVKSSDVNYAVVGSYTVVLSVTDSAGNETTANRKVVVSDDVELVALAQYTSGVDLSKLDAENKGILFAALENYLLDNVYGGVPLYTAATRVMYSDRVQLYSDTYNGVLGFGTGFSQFTADDSSVKMYGDTYGNAGEYTWRASFTTDPTSLNPWIADDSNSSDFIDLFTGSLYEFFFDETKTGYEVLPSLASAEPVAVGGEEINGKMYATTWQIPLRDDLVWTFHEDTDTTALAAINADYATLDANDYMWTYKTAFDLSWFRATSGGGDFVSQGVKNAGEYAAGNVTWDQVGLKALDDNTLQIEFTQDKTAYDIKTMFSGSLTPINPELFEVLGATGYGQGPASVASSGVYFFDLWTAGQLLTFKKNTAHPDSDSYHYTGYQYRYIADQDTAFAEFLAGRLESTSIPSSQLANYLNDSRVKVAPAATTWRLMINAFGTEDNRDAFIAEYPGIGLDEDYVPEPILQYLDMRQALYYGFNRYHAAIEVVGTYLPAYTYFTSTYFLDGESGVSVRGTEAGMATLETYGAASYGYFPDAAADLFQAAVTQAIADGFYTAGTASAYTTIEIGLVYASSGNTSAQAMVAELEKQYEEILVDNVNFVNVDIVVSDVSFPGNYYDYMMVANFDLGIGGISGSLLNAPSFLDVFDDDNRGGFTLNWGIDTTTANIVVTYTNLEGEEVTERWGYNALVEALNGNTYVRDGVEQTSWTAEAEVINAYLDMNGEVFSSSADGSALAEYVLGDTLANIATEQGFTGLNAFTVVAESGANYLYVVAEEDGEFSLYDSQSLFTTAEAAIDGYVYSNYGYHLTAYSLLDDAGVAADAYLDGAYATVAEVAADVDAPAQYTEVYATTWDGGWSDAFVVLHIGDYYIPWYWL